MNDQEVREAIQAAHHAQELRRGRLVDARSTLLEVQAAYTGIHTRDANKVVTQAQRAVAAVEALLEAGV